MAETRPTERTPFFEFQARNRWATWRLTLAYALVVGGCGFVSASVFGVDVAPLTQTAMRTCDDSETST
jgi:hypothetical protein